MKATEARKEAEQYNVKGVKTFRGHDGIGVNANLYHGKKKIAEVHDGAYGGALEVHWVDFNNSRKLDALLKDLPEQPDSYEDSGFSKLDAEDFINRLINRELLSKELKKKLKKNVIALTNKNILTQWGWKGNPIITQRHIDHIKYRHKDIRGLTLNELPFNQALHIYEANV